MNSPSLIDLVEALRCSGLAVEQDLEGSQFTTYRIGGPLSYCLRLNNFQDIDSLSKLIADGFKGVLDSTNVLVVGNGSNLLIDDDGFSGLVLLLEGQLCQVGEIERLSNGEVLVNAGAGLSLPKFARQIASQEIDGLEFFVGIPGTIGGALAMNAGGHGKQTCDVLESTKVLDLTTGISRILDVEECKFSYRSSRFCRTDLISSASFRGSIASVESIKKKLDEIVSWRRENQPGGRNAGSVFQNPPDVSAGSLIEGCGLKGYSIGGASVSSKHANFIQADEYAKAKDIRDLIIYIQRRVFEFSGYELKTELRYISNYE